MPGHAAHPNHRATVRMPRGAAPRGRSWAVLFRFWTLPVTGAWNRSFRQLQPAVRGERLTEEASGMNPEETQEHSAANTTETLTPEDLAAEDLIEEVSIDGMCGVY